MSAPMICGRVNPIRDVSHAGKIAAHGRRGGDYSYEHCSNGRRGLTVAGVSARLAHLIPDPSNVVQALAVNGKALGARTWSRAAIGAEILITVSAQALEANGWAEKQSAVMSADADAVGDDIGRTNAITPTDGSDWAVQFGTDNEARRTGAGGAARTVFSFEIFQAQWQKVRLAASDCDAEWLERFDAKKVWAWACLNLRELEAHDGWTVAAWRLDCDEFTPHLHLAMVPTSVRNNQVWVCYRDHFNKPSQKSALQDTLAAINAPLGIQRGVPRWKSDAERVAPRLHRQIERRRDELRHLKTSTVAARRRLRKIEADRTTQEENLRSAALELIQAKRGGQALRVETEHILCQNQIARQNALDLLTAVQRRSRWCDERKADIFVLMKDTARAAKLVLPLLESDVQEFEEAKPVYDALRDRLAAMLHSKELATRPAPEDLLIEAHLTSRGSSMSIGASP